VERPFMRAAGSPRHRACRVSFFDTSSQAPKKQSVFKLNTYFHDPGEWDEDEITRRGEYLFGLAQSVWPHPGPGAAE
jgi:hypothetical protein